MSQRNPRIIHQPAKFRAQLLRLVLASLFALHAPFASAAPVASRAMADPGEAVLAARTNSTTPPIDGPDPCASLTPAAIQHVIDVIAQSRAKAESDVAATVAKGAYVVNAQYNLESLQRAHDKIIALQSWLQTNGYDAPYVANHVAASSVHVYMGEVTVSLNYARVYATISAVHNKNKDARDSYELTTEALNLAEALGAQAGRCYVAKAFDPLTLRPSVLKNCFTNSSLAGLDQLPAGIGP